MPSFDIGLPTLSAALPQGHTRKYILPGNAGTAQTIRQMQTLASHGKRDMRVRKLAISLIKDCPNKDYLCFAERIYDYCTHKLKYVFDPNGVELVETPWTVIEAGGGDCDSVVMVLAAMLESVGLACKYVTIKADSLRPNEFSHVYLECMVPGQGWVAMDSTMPDKPFGWRPGENFPRKDWPASKDSPEVREGDAMAGLGMDLPYAEQTPGVAVGHAWNWRPEAGIVITGAPEVIDLTTQDPEPEPHQREEEFLQQEQIEALMQKGPPVELSNNPVLSPLALLALAGVAFLIWGRRK